MRFKHHPLLFASLVSFASLAACGDHVEISCFVAGTLVATPSGPRRIETLVAGDLVWSWGARERAPVARLVAQVHRVRATEVRRIRFAGGALAGVTPSHPLWIESAGDWRAASSVKAGDLLLVRDGTTCSARAVVGISATEASEPAFDVYTLTIAGPEECFFADGVLVHNKSPPASTCTATTTVQAVTTPFEGMVAGDLLIVLPAGTRSAPQVTLEEERLDVTSLDASFDRWRADAKNISPGPHSVHVTAAHATCPVDVTASVVLPAAPRDAGSD